MGKILDKIKYEIRDSKSIISFTTEGGGDWKVWDRYLTIEGEKAFHIGNVCGTCSFFFERLGGANKHLSPREVSLELKKGITYIDKKLLMEVSKIIPNGKYLITITEVTPKLITLGHEQDYFTHEQVDTWGIDGFWGLPHYPKVQYYRGATKQFEPNKSLYEFVVPMFPPNWLEEDTINEYIKLINSGEKPTAITLSVLDIKEPSNLESTAKNISSHYCLAHYLIDGHHKVFTASKLNEPITLLNFVSLEQGISNEEEIIELYDNII